MVDKINVERLTAVTARQAIDAGTLTAGRLLEACLERIGAREYEVQAWAFLDPVAARRQAARLDAGPSRGLLHGIPLGVKDIFDTHDMPSRYGSPIYQHHHPQWDAASVADFHIPLGHYAV